MLSKVYEMVLSYFVGRYLLKPENLDPEFNLAAWNELNPDFYVPPHPVLYLLYFK